MVRWVVGSILHGVDPLSYFLFQPVLHDWCNKSCGMCYPVYGMVHIKEPLLLLRKSSPCGGSRFYLSLSEWSLIVIYVTMAEYSWILLLVYIYLFSLGFLFCFSFIHLFIHSFIQLYIHSFIYLFIYLYFLLFFNCICFLFFQIEQLKSKDKTISHLEKELGRISGYALSVGEETSTRTDGRGPDTGVAETPPGMKMEADASDKLSSSPNRLRDGYETNANVTNIEIVSSIQVTL